MQPDFVVRIRGTEILNDRRRESLEELIDLLREDGLDGEIAYRPPTGRGVTLIELTLIYLGGKLLDAATGQIAKHVIDGVVKRATRWAIGRLRRGETSREQLIAIYGPDGKIIKEVRINKDDTQDETL